MRIPLWLLVAGSGLVSAECPTLQMFSARGTTEGEGSGEQGRYQGLLGLATSKVLAQVPGSNASGILYPASLDINSYFAGVGNLTQTLMSFSTACPASKIALLGYSQGALVLSDTLCGRDRGDNQMAPIDLQYTKNVVAIATVADPANTPALIGVNKFGNSTLPGGLARKNLSACAAYSGRFGNWCEKDDVVCDGSQGNLVIHVYEIFSYQYEIANWIVSNYYSAIGQPNPYSAPISTIAASTTSAPAMTLTSVSTLPALTSTSRASPYTNSTTTVSLAPNATISTSAPLTSAATTTKTTAYSTAGATRNQYVGVFLGLNILAAVVGNIH